MTYKMHWVTCRTQIMVGTHCCNKRNWHHGWKCCNKGKQKHHCNNKPWLLAQTLDTTVACYSSWVRVNYVHNFFKPCLSMKQLVDVSPPEMWNEKHILNSGVLQFNTVLSWARWFQSIISHTNIQFNNIPHPSLPSDFHIKSCSDFSSPSCVLHVLTITTSMIWSP